MELRTAPNEILNRGRQTQMAFTKSKSNIYHLLMGHSVNGFVTAREKYHALREKIEGRASAQWKRSSTASVTSDLINSFTIIMIQS